MSGSALSCYKQLFYYPVALASALMQFSQFLNFKDDEEKDCWVQFWKEEFEKYVTEEGIKRLKVGPTMSVEQNELMYL